MNAVFRVAGRVAGAAAVFCIVVAQVCAAAAPGSPDQEPPDRAIEKYIRQLAQPLDVNVQHTLDRIHGTGRQLLALRSYLRARSSLAARWSWSETEIAAYKESQQYRDMMAEIGKVTAQFERSNPGFTLYANSEVRSLDDQIGKWNSNAAVGEIADQLLPAAREHLTRSSKLPASARRARLREFLLAWQPETPAPLAAPGLSLHGRGRALDFQVQWGDRIVAGTDITTIAGVWVGQAWAQKLTAAVDTASSRFRGPLTLPNEPWHFEYQP